MNTKPKKFYTTGVLLLSAALTFGSVAPAAWAADGGTTSGAAAAISLGSAPVLGSVPVAGSSSFELKDVLMLQEQKNKTVTFTVSINNEGSGDLLFIDYWVRIKTKSGQTISVRQMPQDKDKNKVSPGTRMDIGFFASVSDTTELTDLTFEFIKWDFSQSDFERKIGEIAVPESYSVLTEPGASRSILMEGNAVNTTIKKVLLTKNEKNYAPTLIVNLENVGSRSSAVPTYQYLLRTSEGYMYPLEAKGVKDVSIHPQTNKEIELSGSVPVSVSTDGWQLVIMQHASDLKINLPIAFFALPPVSPTDDVDTGKEYNFSNKEGTYTTQLQSLTRVPWEDQDLLTASMILSNKGDKSLPLPELAGYFMLDDAVKVEAKLIRTDKVIGLAPKAAATFQFVGKMPYTYEFGKAKLVLLEKEGTSGGSAGGDSGTGGSVTELLEFVHRSELMNVPYLNAFETYQVKSIGRSASYSARNTRIYEGETSDLLTIQLEASNLEKRAIDVTKLVAHFKTTDGTVLPAAVSEIKTKIRPDGKAVLLVSANVPKDFQTAGMQLLIGEAVTDNKLTEKDGQPDAYVNAAGFWLPEQDTAVKDDLLEVELAPYKFSMNRIKTALGQTGVTLEFDYKLSRDMMVEMNNEGRKLVIGFEDENGKLEFTQEFELKDFETASAASGAASKADDKLRLGSYKEFQIKVSDSDLIYRLQFLKTYQLSIYDSYQGHKRLLAKKKVDWFSMTD
ncbi:hypothetical protein RAC89_21860 [Paenibacillus sp. GD4]|uniref:hypothetical protein n=1 Tax=Paenibacillus sp. GD4 TaxID=3068890 RepID=UPI002796A55B|nr:hypothetical protein [Paenibacillus sp. GD4]MDQ1913046.1 hypothetical protein [Paenibacillus sp. GD4]